DADQTRRELVELFATLKGFEVVGQAGSVREALSGIEATMPEGVTLDISLAPRPGPKGLSETSRVGVPLWET
ncbi:MAG: hypothetical protein JO251_02780, partial [Verrucomicrobia bacterium]|nr:hypothetical protein [Verrucomicrobiota bacterium]